MSKKIGGYRDKTRFTATASTLTLRLYIEEPASRVHVEAVSFRNQTSSGDLCTPGIEVGGYCYAAKSITMTTLLLWYHHHIDSCVFPGEALRFDFTGLTVGDVIEVHAVGYIEYDE